MMRRDTPKSCAGWSDLLGAAARTAMPADARLSGQSPFVLLDDARNGGTAFLFHSPRSVLVAETPDIVRETLAAAEAAARQGGMVAGYLAYEAAAAFEPRLAGRLPMPEGPLAWFGVFEGCTPLDDLAGNLPRPRAPGAAALPQCSQSWHADAVGSALDFIAAGDIYQANLTFPAYLPVEDPLALYATLRHRQRAGWGGIIWSGDRWLLSCSPELFFALDGQGLTARPMKGTARRNGSDDGVAHRLREDPKERAENLMIVDLMRNDFSRVAQPGSVAVPALFEVEAYPTIFQMTSTVTARVRDGMGITEILAATFPCGSVTGAPKLRAMEVIAQLECGPRGAYTGSMGFMAPGGRAAFNVLIRTVALGAGADRGVLQVGSGIVSDSRPESEWRECLGKLAFAHPAGLAAKASSAAPDD